MNRTQRIAIITLIVLGMLTLATAAYAPHSSTLAKAAQKTAYVAPCAATPSLVSPVYPIPSPDVIERGHSAGATH
jgi:hypothetical protein